MKNPGREFRRLLAKNDYVYTTGVYSPLQAKIASLVGLKAVVISGYSSSLGYLGKADLGFLGMAEMATIARYVTAAVDIPVISDADDGYGNALVAMRTVSEFESSGVAGIHVEDQKGPKRCGHLAGKVILPLDEAVGKVRAMVDAKQNSDFVLIARTDARGAIGGNLGKAIERGLAYAHAGADMLFCEFTSPDAVNEFRTFSDAIHREFREMPLMFNYSSSFNWSNSKNRLTFKQIAEMGYKLIVISLGATHAEMFSMWNFANDLKEHQEKAQFRLESTIAGHPTENHHRLGDFEHFQKLEETYLPKDLVKKKYTKSIGYGKL